MNRLTNLNLSLAAIRPGPWQPRISMDGARLQELADSIREHGLIYPVLVRMMDGGYELLSGERRWRAAAIAGLQEIQATVLVGSDEELHELALLDNIQRENLTPLEEAYAYDGLMSAHAYTTEQVAQRLGKSNGYVADRLKLLELSPQAAELAAEREIPQRTLRDVATLPEPVQKAALEYLEVGKGWEQQVTTRQATNFCKDVLKFLDQERWVIRLDQVVEPTVRNAVRLIRDLLATADLEKIAPRLVTLRHAGYYRRNVLSKAPASMQEDDFRWILDALTGREGMRLTEQWAELAPARNWRCGTCVFGGEPIEPREEFDPYCLRAETTETCCGYIGRGDPVVIPLDYIVDHFRQVAAEGEIHEPEGLAPYVAEVETYRRLYPLACKEVARAKLEAAQAGRRLHVEPLREYARRILEDERLASDYGMAHRCTRCANFRKGEGSYDLCRYLEEPLHDRFREGVTRAPTFWVLVRQDGLMVPRCEMFRYSPEALPKLPELLIRFYVDREVALRWLDSICLLWGQDHHHEQPLQGILAWLPYARARDRSWDREKLLDHLRQEWDSYGDGVVAWLVDAALGEALAKRSASSWRLGGGVLRLPNPASGLVEEWAAVSWSQWAGRQKPDYGWPEGWPTPWVEKEEEA